MNERATGLRHYLELLERVPEVYRCAWDAVAVYDPDGRLVSQNAAAEALTGSAPPEAAAIVADVAADGEPLETEMQFREAGGAPIPVSVRFVPARFEGRVVGVVGFIRDLRAQREQTEREKRLDALAFHDVLTGLPNRALLHDRLEQTLLAARRNQRSFAIHFIDVDHFKAINDTYGHQAGDAVLIAVGNWLRATLRDSDTIARVGGDEFVILQPEVDSVKQAEELAARLVAIRQNRFTIGNVELHITISVGAAVFPADARNPADLLHAADAALYTVKERGRNGYSVGTVM